MSLDLYVLYRPASESDITNQGVAHQSPSCSTVSGVMVLIKDYHACARVIIIISGFIVIAMIIMANHLEVHVGHHDHHARSV